MAKLPKYPTDERISENFFPHTVEKIKKIRGTNTSCGYEDKNGCWYRVSSVWNARLGRCKLVFKKIGYKTREGGFSDSKKDCIYSPKKSK